MERITRHHPSSYQEEHDDTAKMFRSSACRDVLFGEALQIHRRYTFSPLARDIHYNSCGSREVDTERVMRLQDTWEKDKRHGPLDDATIIAFLLLSGSGGSLLGRES